LILCLSIMKRMRNSADFSIVFNYEILQHRASTQSRWCKSTANKTFPLESSGKNVKIGPNFSESCDETLNVWFYRYSKYVFNYCAHSWQWRTIHNRRTMSDTEFSRTSEKLVFWDLSDSRLFGTGAKLSGTLRHQIVVPKCPCNMMFRDVTAALGLLCCGSGTY